MIIKLKNLNKIQKHPKLILINYDIIIIIKLFKLILKLNLTVTFNHFKKHVNCFSTK